MEQEHNITDIAIHSSSEYEQDPPEEELKQSAKEEVKISKGSPDQETKSFDKIKLLANRDKDKLKA